MKPKHLIYFIIFAVGAAWFAGSHADTVSENAPIAVAPEATYQFKTVPEGTQVTHEFKIQNKGTAPLIIERVNTG